MLVLALTFVVLLFPTPGGLSIEGHRALAALVFTGSILALRPVSLPIAGLMIPVVQILLGIAESAQVFEPFSRPIIFLILGSLFLAEALRKYGLTRRIALSVIVATGGSIRKILLALMLIAAIFSMWVENTATAAVLIPIAMTIITDLDDSEECGRILSLLVLGIAYGSSLGGMVTVMGSASNAVAYGFLREIQVLTFLDWLRFGLPSFLVIFPITWWLLLRIIKIKTQEMDLKVACKEMEKLGRMQSSERDVLIALSLAICFWIGGPFIEAALGLSNNVLSPAVVAIVAVSYLSLRRIIDWEDVKGVSWGFLFIIGAGLSLGETLQRTGVTNWLVNLITPIIYDTSLLLSILFLVFLSAILTNIMNNATVVAVFVPILLSISNVDPMFKPLQLVLPVTLATTFGYSLPSASGRMALIAASGTVNNKEMIKYGLIMTIVSSIALAFLFYVLVLLNWI